MLNTLTLMKYVIIHLICVASFLCQAQHPNKGVFKLSGYIADKSVTKLIFSQLDLISDTVLVKNGKFIFTGLINEPNKFTVKPVNQNRSIPIFIEPGEQYLEILDSTYMVRDSYINAQLKMYSKFTDSSRNVLIDIFSKKSSLNPSTDSLELIKLRKLNDSVSINYFKGLKTFIEQKPYSYFNLYLLSANYTTFGDLYTKKILSLLAPNFRTYPSYQNITKVLESAKLLEIGDKISPFSLSDVRGEKYGVNTFKNKLLFFDFWATWCGPCIKEFPKVRVLYEKYKTADIEFIFISIDKDRQKWVQFLDRNTLPGIQLIDKKNIGSKSVAENYRVSAIPTNYLVNAEGIVIGVDLHGEALEKAISDALKKL